MHPTIENLLKQSPYEQLPECIRHVYSEREYLFMSDDQKANLERTETEPEVDL